MKDLTKAEEQVMHILWELKEGVIKDIIKELPDPKPAYNTVSTIVRILEKKDVVSHRAIGKTHIYFPLISKETYRAYQSQGLMQKFFGNSPKKLLSYFIEKENLDVSELDEILKIIQDKREKK